MPRNFLTESKSVDPVQLTGLFFALFCVLPVAIVLYVFYGEEVRSRLENDLFDIRSRIKPQIADTSRLAVVTVSQKDIALLEQTNAQVPSYESLKQLIHYVMASDPESVALVIPHHDLNYESEKFSQFISILSEYPQLYFGSFDHNFKEPTDSLLPDAFLRFPEREFGTGTVRQYRREVIRTLPLMSYRDEHLVYQLPNKMALNLLNGSKKNALKKLNHDQLRIHKQDVESRDHWDAPPLPQMSLNYVKPHLFLHVGTAELDKNKMDQRLAGRVVLIGYTAYRKRTYEHRDGTYVNTPWEWDGNAEVFGSPLVYVLANQFQNLLEGTWLAEAPPWVNLIQTIIFSLISFLVWRLPPFLAVVLFCAIQGGLLWVHGMIFAVLSTQIPLADTVLFSVLSTIAGAFLRAHQNSLALAKSELRAVSKKKLAMIQSKFLNRFSFELYEYNSKIGSILGQKTLVNYESDSVKQIWQKALGSSEELQDYLSGIKQYSMLTGGEARRVRKSPVSLLPLIRRILVQFESKIEESQIQLNFEDKSNIKVWTDEFILEPVLFNFVSNAIKYSPKGGTVAISLSPEGDDRVLISVSDEGPGISPEFHSKIFEKFYRVKNDDVYKVKGNGLGLYLCRYFSEKISAQIRLKSIQGEGSEFTLAVEAYHG